MNEHLHNFYLFRTNVNTTSQVDALTPYLNRLVISGKWSFDLEDCDLVFCLTCEDVVKHKVVGFLKSKGFALEELH